MKLNRSIQRTVTMERNGLKYRLDESILETVVESARNLTVSQAFQEWSKEHYRLITPKGVEGYTSAWKVLSVLGDIQLTDLRTSAIQKVIDEYVALGRSREAAAKVKQLASQLCRFGMREDILSRNYADYIILPKGVKREKVIFSDDEIQTLLDNSLNEAVMLILILIYSGMRIGELFTLRTSDVHPDERYMVGGIKSDAGRNRLIPISDKISDFIWYFFRRADGELLISGYAGNRKPDNFRKRDFYPALYNLSLNEPFKTPHSTRHTFASLMVRAGVAPELLRQIIGHADYSTTANIYVHTDRAQLLDAIKKL